MEVHLWGAALDPFAHSVRPSSSVQWPRCGLRLTWRVDLLRVFVATLVRNPIVSHDKRLLFVRAQVDA